MTSRIRNQVPYLLISCCVFATTFIWHFNNRGLPTWDGGQYAITSLEISNKLQNNPFLGLNDLYFNRIWRPISFPSLSSIVFLLSNKLNLNIQLGIMQLLAMTFLGFATYKISLKYLSAPLSTAVACFLISSSWLLEYSHEYFYSEPTWLCILAWWLFFKISTESSENNRNKLISGIFLGIALTIRPIESILFASVFYIPNLKKDFRKNYLVNLGAIILLIIGLISFSYIEWRLYQQKSNTKFLEVIILLLWISLIYAYQKSKQISISPLAIAIIIAFGWFIPFNSMLIGWVYESSFGSWAKLSNLTYLNSPLLFPVIKEFSYYAPRITLTLISISFILMFYNRTFKKQEYDGLDILLILTYISFVPILLSLITSRATDPRKIMAQIYFAILFSLLQILRNQSLLKKSFVIAISIIIMFSLNYSRIALKDYPERDASYLKYEKVFGIQRPPLLKQDPNRVLNDWVSSKIGERNRIAIYSHGLLATNTYIANKLPIVNPTGLTLASLEEGKENYYTYESNLLFGEFSMKLLQKTLIKNHIDFLILDTFKGPIGSEVNRKQGLYVSVTNLINSQAGSTLPFKEKICEKILNRKWCIYVIS